MVDELTMNGDQITPPELGCQAPGLVLYLLPERWEKKIPYTEFMYVRLLPEPQ